MKFWPVQMDARAAKLRRCHRPTEGHSPAKQVVVSVPPETSHNMIAYYLQYNGALRVAKTEAHVLKLLLNNFAEEIRTKVQKGFLNREWVTDGIWIEQRWLHAAMWGALIRAIPDGYLPLVEPSISSDFKPDLVVINDKHEKVAVVEYESSNSSDERLVAKDLRHYEQAILEYKGRENHPGESAWSLPALWLLISTLPNCPVRGWPWHGYNRDSQYCKSVKDRAARDKSPLAYYEPCLHEACKMTWHRVSAALGGTGLEGVQLAWANIDEQRLRVMNINGQPQEGEAGRLEFPPVF